MRRLLSLRSSSGGKQGRMRRCGSIRGFEGEQKKRECVNVGAEGVQTVAKELGLGRYSGLRSSNSSKRTGITTIQRLKEFER